MGQKVHATGFRLGICQGWDSSWSLDPTQRGYDYRHNLHMDLEIRNLITQLFASKHGYIGKMGISKNSNTGIVDINVFGYIPGEVKKYSLNGHTNSTEKEELGVLLKRLTEVFNKKYAPEIFTLNCVLVQGIVSARGKKQDFLKKSFTKRKNRSKIRRLSTTKLVDSRINIKSDNCTENRNKSWKKFKIKSVIESGMKEFDHLAKNPYFESMINIVFLVCKTKQPQFLASFLARELGKTRKQRALYQHITAVCGFFFKIMPNLQGIRIQVCGRMNKSKRSRKYVVQHGRIPSQTAIREVKYGFDEAYTAYGSMGVKVWLAC